MNERKGNMDLSYNRKVNQVKGSREIFEINISTELTFRAYHSAAGLNSFAILIHTGYDPLERNDGPGP